jgi:3-phenylpropionate/cinnamic acid dioxygenase small subunit
MLKDILRFAISTGVVTNQGFADWHEIVRKRARYRVEQDRFREMLEQKTTSMVWDESLVRVTEEDERVDYVGMLLDTIPQIRNSYAHGSSNLHNQGLQTIQIVAEIINQLFPRPSA